jgi:hypothetical protein
MPAGDRNVSTTINTTVSLDNGTAPATVYSIGFSQSTTTVLANLVPDYTLVNLPANGNSAAIPIPNTAKGLRIISTGIGNPKLIKGAVGETGLVFGPDADCVLFFPPASMASFFIHSQVAETVKVVWL